MCVFGATGIPAGPTKWAALQQAREEEEKKRNPEQIKASPAWAGQPKNKSKTALSGVSCCFSSSWRAVARLPGQPAATEQQLRGWAQIAWHAFLLLGLTMI